jgi:hypothetical protein
MFVSLESEMPLYDPDETLYDSRSHDKEGFLSQIPRTEQTNHEIRVIPADLAWSYAAIER